VLTVSAVAEHKQIHPEKIEVRVSRHVEEAKRIQTELEIKIGLGEGLSRREQVLLYNAARTCDIGKMLKGQFRFSYRIEQPQ
jgi:uncharacterized OsmC-like protein